MVECDHELTLRSRPVRRYHQDWRVSTPPDGVGTLACANASVLTHEGKRPPDHSGATGLSVSTATTTSRTQAGPDARPERARHRRWSAARAVPRPATQEVSRPLFGLGPPISRRPRRLG